jgi:hypothetical protein
MGCGLGGERSAKAIARCLARAERQRARLKGRQRNASAKASSVRLDPAILTAHNVLTLLRPSSYRSLSISPLPIPSDPSSQH